MLKQLITLRKQKKLTIQNMADALGIAKSTYASYETGYRQPPVDALIKIADFFSISLDQLVDRHFFPDFYLDQPEKAHGRLFIDGRTLTEEEQKEVIAFIKVKRRLP
ncbi:helix-turn-helix domain-containing protein [Sporolactobacillus sp. THM19-2]|uniref:helix-turn-helix domain-containing protein n=1 Tax=Sporolactobacillus sp. THM19-2 TaxID=2511171 RepID=UPI0010209245|nr:helix-turn-helix transcriptional regulator [Sporolactobacillus sp. THM19-2]RYL91641.1 XRE family transcriptional regulator [Sporolactobacillus sp. THM19-2]